MKHTSRAIKIIGIAAFIIYCVPAQATASEKYTGPLIDSHFHMPANLDEPEPNPQLGRNVKLSTIVKSFKGEGTRSAFAFFPVFESYPSQRFIASAKRAEKKHPKKFVTFIMPPTGDDNPPTVGYKKLEKMLNDNPGLFQGYGEIGLYNFDGKTGRQYPPDHPIFKKIYPIIREHNLLVYFHPGNNQADNFERALKKNPDITFIVHGDQIRNDIVALMDEYPNIYYTVDNLYADQYLIREGVSKQDFFDALADYDTLLAADEVLWKDMIESHPNRFMWGTDRGDVLWAYNHEVGAKMADYVRHFIVRLDEDVQAKFAYKNAQRLINNSGR